MISFENTVDIAREPVDVYAYLADLEHTPEWNWAIASTTKVTPGPVAVGTRYRQLRTAPRRAVETIEITGLSESRRIEVAGRLGPFDARLSYQLADVPSGTRLTNRVELDAPIPLGPLTGVLGGRIRDAVAENLDVLRGRLEQSAAHETTLS
jgi:Polyketide cyclase / dehydrase and lipid transport